MGAARAGLSWAGKAGGVTFTEMSEVVFGLRGLVDGQAGIAGSLTSNRDPGAGSCLGSLMERESKEALLKSISFLRYRPILPPRAAKTPSASNPSFPTLLKSLAP